MSRGALLFYLVAAAAVGVTAALHGHEAVLAQARAPEVMALLGLAVGLGATALVASALEARAARRRAPRDVGPVQLELLDPAASREVILQVAEGLRPAVEAEQPDIIALVDALMRAALNLGASDLHLQPLESGSLVNFRIAGVLEEVLTLPPHLHAPVVNRVKVLGQLITYASRPQDGHLTASGPDGPVDVRVSLLPTNHGEKVVLRFAKARVQMPELKALGFTPRLLERFLPLLERQQGLIFITGPTGSGKTTTIYASLSHIKKQRGDTTHIASIEDPVEFDLPFISQTQVRPEAGLTFAQGLRSMLRQDPNVMMVGEIRDAETAGIALQAGLTGHLILTTVHAESAPGVFTRLLEIGVEPYALASASLAALSQRLVRALCPKCRRPGPPTPAQRARLEPLGVTVDTVFHPVGCAACGTRGYLGRTALVELLEVTPDVATRINARVPTAAVAGSAQSTAMSTLLQDGLSKAAAGVTSLDEVLRVLA